MCATEVISINVHDSTHVHPTPARDSTHLSEWVSFEAIVCHDSPQVRVTQEEDTKQVPNLPLVPIGGSEHTRRTWNRCDLICIRLDSDSRVELDAQQMVYDFESLGTCGVVGSRDVHQRSELTLSVVSKESQGGDDGRWVDIECQFVLDDGELLDVFGEAGGDVRSVVVEASGDFRVFVDGVRAG